MLKKVRVSVYTKTGNTASIDSRNTRISKNYGVDVKAVMTKAKKDDGQDEE